jgi:hypothetical protein
MQLQQLPGENAVQLRLRVEAIAERCRTEGAPMDKSSQTRRFAYALQSRHHKLIVPIPMT